MDFRRIIAFGKSSHVVSLPKSWLNENKLKKGDLVYLEQDFDKLVIICLHGKLVICYRLVN